MIRFDTALLFPEPSEIVPLTPCCLVFGAFSKPSWRLFQTSPSARSLLLVLVVVSRLALERQSQELRIRQAEIPGETGLARVEKEVAVVEARRRHALRNSLTHYAGKVGGSLGKFW